MVLLSKRFYARLPFMPREIINFDELFVTGLPGDTFVDWGSECSSGMILTFLSTGKDFDGDRYIEFKYPEGYRYDIGAFWESFSYEVTFLILDRKE